jgi:hypothetical protein
MSDPTLVDLYAEALSEARKTALALGDLSFLSVDQLAVAVEVQNALAPEALFQEPSLDRIEERRASLAEAREREQAWHWEEGSAQPEPHPSERGQMLDHACCALFRTHRAAAAAMDRRRALALARDRAAPGA